jgi:hypothetical protein
VQAASEVRDWADDVKDGQFLRALVELGVTVLRVNPTVNLADGTATAEWLEAGLSGDAKGMAKGLSLFAEGLDSISLATKAVEFATRLVKAADAVTDPGLDQEVLKADVLSELVNLGSIYTNPERYSTLISWNRTGHLEDFLQDIWNYANIQNAENQESLQDIVALSSFIKVDNRLQIFPPILIASSQPESLLIAGLETGTSKLVLKVAQRSLRWLAGKGDNISVHIAKRHIATALGKTTFSNGGKDVKKWVIRAIENPTKITEQGRRMVFEKNFGRTIGTGGEKIVRVVVDKATGKIITAFPTQSLMSISWLGIGVATKKADEAEAAILRIRREHARASEPNWLERVIDFLNPVDSGGVTSDDIFLKERQIIESKIQEAANEIQTRQGSEVSAIEYQEIREIILFQMNLTY